MNAAAPFALAVSQGGYRVHIMHPNKPVRRNRNDWTRGVSADGLPNPYWVGKAVCGMYMTNPRTREDGPTCRTCYDWLRRRTRIEARSRGWSIGDQYPGSFT